MIRRWFPTPEFLIPRTCGVDISDSSVKWMMFSSGEPGHLKVATWGELPLDDGIVVHGIVKDVARLSAVLSRVRQHMGGVNAAHAALPEEAAYVFSMHVPEGALHDQVLSLIEFEFNSRVPIPPSAAVYDFNVIQHHEGETAEIAVVVFPAEVAEAYTEAFEKSGMELRSLEIEAHSIARAVSSTNADEPITLLVDFGRARTGFAVLKRGMPIFTSTVEVGGDSVITAVQKALSTSQEDAEMFSNEEGLFPKDGKRSPGAEAMIGTASTLADEVSRYYRYWDTRRNDQGNRVTPVGNIILVGGSANMNGLVEYIAGRVQARVEKGNIWRHACNFDEYIPPIDARASLKFATAAGLALRGFKN